MKEFIPIESIDSFEDYPLYLATIWDDTGIEFNEQTKLTSEILHTVKDLGILSKINWASYQDLVRASNNKMRSVEIPSENPQKKEVKFNPLDSTLCDVLDHLDSIEVHCIRDIDYGKVIACILFAANADKFKTAIKDLNILANRLIDDRKQLIGN